MNLQVDGQEQLCPDRIANPSIQKFYMCLGKKAIDSNYTIPTTDKYAQAVLEPRIDTMPGAKEALDQCSIQFASIMPGSTTPNSAQDNFVSRYCILFLQSATLICMHIYKALTTSLGMILQISGSTRRF